MRIQKYISQSGKFSRRKAEEEILKGNFLVNGKKAIIGQDVIESDEIIYLYKEKNGIKKERIYIEKEKKYYLLNKPLGYICTNKEQFNRPIVTELIKTDVRLVTVGRLDMYTTGAIILTNDGETVQKITHPKYMLDKEYFVTVKGKISDEQLEKMRKGVEIDGYITKPAKIKMLGVNAEKQTSRFKIVIHEGKNRQVRKMSKAVGLKVLALHRNRIGNLDVQKIRQGEYIELSKNQIDKLFKK
ncbi:MAG: pseudouridine synthase [Clostridium sp.]